MNNKKKIRENVFQEHLIKRLKAEFGTDNIMITKNDPNYIQGFPDLTILGNKRYALLECKRERTAHRQPNQEYYIAKANRLSYGTFVYPENEDEVIEDLKRILI